MKPAVQSVGEGELPHPLERDLPEQVLVVPDEVVGVHPAVPRQVGRPAEAAPPPVRDPRVDHGDRHAPAAGHAVATCDAPGLGRVDPERPGEVPLQLAPVSRPAVSGIVGEPGSREGGGVHAEVGHGVAHAGLLAQFPDRARDRAPALDLQDLCSVGQRPDRRGVRGLLGAHLLGLIGRGVVAHDHLVRDRCLPRCAVGCAGRCGSGQGARERCRQDEGADSHLVTVR